MSTDPTPIISRRLPDGTLIETIYDRDAGTTAFAIGSPDGTVRIDDHYVTPSGERLVPYSATNNLLTSGCVLLPSGLGEFGDKGDMASAIQVYLARYVELSPAFAEIAAYYVLLTWTYDSFRELPYLRFRGDFGTGKTRALITVGSICYKPFFASGASTVSPIFHILDAFRGTLVLDEADFRFSDATNELTKILNNGNVDGLPVLRTMTNRHRELNPQAFRVFGPKIIAMREGFADDALESRFFTEETGRAALSPHIPLHTPDALAQEAKVLRNRLLAWRLTAARAVAPDPSRLMAGVSPRLNQTALALLSLVDDDEARQRITEHLTARREDPSDRHRVEVDVLVAVVDALASARNPFVPIAQIAERYNAQILERFHIPVSNKWIGFIVRTKLGISTAKSHGVYGIPQTERHRVQALAERFGVPHSFDADVLSHFAEAAEMHASTDAG